MKKLYIKPEFDPCELETEILAKSGDVTFGGGTSGGGIISADGKETDRDDDFDEEW